MMIFLICKLSGEVGQYVTNKRDFHTHVPARTLWWSNRSAAPWGYDQTLKIPTVHEADVDCSRLLTCNPMFYCLKRNGVRGTWFKNAALRVPVRTGMCNDTQVQLIITEARRKSQHFPGETNWWWKALPDDEQSPCKLAFPVINSHQCLSSFLRRPPRHDLSLMCAQDSRR